MRSIYTAALAAVLTVPALASAQVAPVTSPLYAGCGVYSCYTLQGTLTPSVNAPSNTYDLRARLTFSILPAAAAAGFDFVSFGAARFDFFNTPGRQQIFEDAGFLPVLYSVPMLAGQPAVEYNFSVFAIPFLPTFGGATGSVTFASNTTGMRQGGEAYALTATPEPVTLVLSAAGLMGLGLVARRRRA